MPTQYRPLFASYKTLVGTALVTGIGIVGMLMASTVARAQAVTPTCTLRAVPEQITPGDYVTLTWSSTDATSLSFDQGIGTSTSPQKGSLSIQATSTPLTYTGVFSGPGGSATCFATVTSTSAQSTALTAPGTTATATPILISAPIVATGPLPTVVTIDDNGKALIRGAVTSVSRDSLTIASWGGSWKIPLSSTADITPLGTNGAQDFTGITYGDFVGVSGTILAGEPWTIQPTIVRDWTKNPLNQTPSSDDSGTATSSGAGTTTVSGLPSGDSLYTGTVSEFSENSFSLTSRDGTQYPVTLAPNALVWNNNGETIPFSSFIAGDSVRLDGSLQLDGSILADVIRDTAQ